MISAVRTNLIHPLSLIFCNDTDRDINFLVARISNWTGAHLTACLRLSNEDSELLCFETRLLCMKLQIEEDPRQDCDLISCHLGLNDGSEDFRSYQALVLFLLFQVLNKRLNIPSAQMKLGNTLIADYYTDDDRVVYDRLSPNYPISNPLHLVNLLSRVPELPD